VIFPFKPSAASAKYVVHAAGLLLVVAGFVTWGKLLTRPAQQAPAAPMQSSQADPTADALAAWFGPGELRANVAVKGLIRGNGQGVAVLAVNDGAARPYRVGETLARSVTLKSIETDAVVIDKAGVAERIAAPVLPQAATPGIARPVR
jgi:Type II secretion system protein C